ncbi:MAG: prepilin-type N-terminal cleavage/methylation domain-containing protein [Candidatus Omnitrophota bacterium]
MNKIIMRIMIAYSVERIAYRIKYGAERHSFYYPLNAIRSTLKRKGFTLVELMVAVCILSLGIVLVSRSFLSAASALNSVQSRIEAVQFLEDKISLLEEKAKQEKGLSPEEKEEETVINNRISIYNSKIMPLEVEGLEEDINEARLKLTWKENNIDKNETMGSYFKNKE